MKSKSKISIHFASIILMVMLSMSNIWSQNVEVTGALKVSQMNENQSGENLVVRNSDGTLGTRSVETLPQAASAIDSTRNLASDFELQKLLCDCPNPSPLLIKKLLDSGYTPEDLINGGLATEDVINASRSGILYDARDGHAYKTVQIGSQTWMAENLNIGNRIDSLADPSDNGIIEKYCYGDSESNCEVYGGLYKWEEMMNYNVNEAQGICPDGWHIPTDGEWKTMEIYLGMTQSQADDLNYRGTDQGCQIAANEPLWLNGILDQHYAFESSGLNTLPAGFLSTSAYYYGIVRDNYFWTSTESGTSAYWRSLGYNSLQIYRALGQKSEGYSVRCVKD